MGRLEKISYYLKKSASSDEQAFEQAKVRESERRAGISLSDFELQVEEAVFELYEKRISLQEIIMAEYSKDESFKMESFFNSPYDFLVKGLTPKSYAIYLRMKDLV